VRIPFYSHSFSSDLTGRAGGDSISSPGYLLIPYDRIKDVVYGYSG
jgi:hypothetical protein